MPAQTRPARTTPRTPPTTMTSGSPLASSEASGRFRACIHAGRGPVLCDPSESFSPNGRGVCSAVHPPTSHYQRSLLAWASLAIHWDLRAVVKKHCCILSRFSMYSTCPVQRLSKLISLLTKGEYQAEVSQAIRTDGYQEDRYAAGEFRDDIRRLDGILLRRTLPLHPGMLLGEPVDRAGRRGPSQCRQAHHGCREGRHQHVIPFCQSGIDQLTRRART